MARLLYAASAGDYTANTTGLLAPNTDVTIWDAYEGGSQVLDVLPGPGVTFGGGLLQSSEYGLVPFYGPDGFTGDLFLEGAPGLPRARVTPSPTAAANAAIDSRGLLTAASASNTYVRVAEAATGVAATDRANLQAAIDAALAAGGIAGVRLRPGHEYMLDRALIGGSNLVINGQGAKLTMTAGVNEDAVRAVGADNFHVIDLEIDGAKATQTGSGLSGDDATITGRGVFLSGCTRSGLRNVHVHDARLHGMLAYQGSDNYAENVMADANGSLADTRYGNGIFVWDSPRFRGAGLTARDNDANSGIVTKGGAACADVTLSQVFVSGSGASGVSLNSLRVQLTQFFASGSPAGFAGLNLGHSTGADLYCDDFTVSDGLVADNAGIGVNCDGALGGQMSGVAALNSGQNGLRITGGRAGGYRFTGCEFDGVTTSDTATRGQPVLVTAAGAGSAVGDIDFTNCHARNGLRSGVHVIGASNVRWVGGTVQDNTGPGILTADDGAALSGGVLSIGTVFRDTRAGAARTQTYPMQTTGTGGKSACLLYHADNHTSSNVPQMGAASDAQWGYQGTISALGALTPTGGTANAPGHSFHGRTNQGMWSLGSNTVGFAANGQEQARYDTAKWQFATPVRPGIYATAGRPSAASVGAGAMMYDSTLGRPIWSDGANWRDAAGAVV